MSSVAIDVLNVFQKPLEFGLRDHPGLRLQNLTTTQRDALTGSGAAKAGSCIWNTTTAAVEYYDGGAWSGVPVSLSEAELSTLDGVTAGTITASKAVIVDSNADITTFRNLTATNLKAGVSGTAGTVTVFPTTAAKGKAVVTAADNSTDTTTTLAVAAQASTRTYTVPDAGAASANFVLSSGASTVTTATSTELNTVAGVTAGAVTASKAIVVDSGSKIASGLKGVTIDAGTATVAPIILTTGTNLTTAAAGAFEYDGKAFYATAAASSRQVSDCEQFIIQTANSSTYNNTGLDTNTAYQVFSTGSGLVTVQAATTYFFEGLYKLSNTGTTSHTWATLFTLATATMTGIHYTVIGDTRTTSAATIAAASQLDIDVATQVPVTAASTSATEFVTLFLKGYMAVNAGGTVSPAMQASARPGASGTPAVIVLAGSYFRMWPVGTNSVASVGSWA